MNRTMIAVAAATVLSFAAAPAFANDCDKGEIVIKFSHVVAATGNPKGDAATALADRINREMDGKACMEVFPNSQLYDDDKVLEAMLLGDVQLASPSLSKFGCLHQEVRVFDLPFLFRSVAAVQKLHRVAGRRQGCSFHGRRGLCRPRLLDQRHEAVLGREAAAGALRRRGPQVPHPDFRHRRCHDRGDGRNPQKLAFNEVYGALQQVVVDGQENT